MAVTPQTGKTSSRYARLLCNGYNLSGDMRSIGEMGVRFEQADATGWSDDVKQSLADVGEVLMTGVTALMNNTPTATGPTPAGAHQALTGATSFINSFFLGIRAAPAVGDPSFAAVFEKGSLSVSGDVGQTVLLSADFRGTAILPQSINVWGVALATGAALAATGSGGSVDNGASSSGGYIAVLHLTQTAAAMASNNWVFKIEHSANDSTWATLATFAAGGGAITAERLEGSGTVNRYVRFTYTRTAGTARPWVTFIRK